tara:strand:- start:114 stop:623 length:510 start_codon:yes stop_codon:yes gene_type:complete
MNSRILIIVLFVLFNLSHVKADSHDGNEKDILKKAKEINEKVKKKQAEQKSTISAEIGGEEPLPLNDPFVGDASLGGSAASIVVGADADRSEMSLYNFKLIGIMTGEFESFVSLINATGEIVTLQMNEELSPGVKLIGLNPDKAVFEKGVDSYLVINFKNQIKETSEPF